MDVIEFKIKTLCDISFFNEEGEHITSDIILSPIEVDSSLNLSDETREKLKDCNLLLFTTYLIESIKDLEIWQKEKMYLSWEEDDVNFLNFMLRSKCLYSSKIRGTYSNILKELFLRCLTPFILSSTKEDMFYGDLLYWFNTSGKKMYQELELFTELDSVSLHFQR